MLSMQVDEYTSVSEDTFKSITRLDRPALLKDCSFGPCLEKWNLNYLRSVLSEELVVIHKSNDSQLDWLNKNFKYAKVNFKDFSQKLVEGSPEYLYFRSTNTDPRVKKAAKIEVDLPALAQDLQPPHFIPYGPNSEAYYSSILRIASSSVQIWTHFDNYDNVLSQVVGAKDVVLFPPNDCKYLYVKGDKSPINGLDCWEQRLREFPLLRKASPYRCRINPGDTLYIPALWWHNITTVSDHKNEDCGYSIGFNIFWKDQDVASLYAHQDVFGNKSFPAYASAIADLERAINRIGKLPEKYRTFHQLMLLEEFKNRLNMTDHDNDYSLRDK